MASTSSCETETQILADNGQEKSSNQIITVKNANYTLPSNFQFSVVPGQNFQDNCIIHVNNLETVNSNEDMSTSDLNTVFIPTGNESNSPAKSVEESVSPNRSIVKPIDMFPNVYKTGFATVYSESFSIADAQNDSQEERDENQSDKHNAFHAPNENEKKSPVIMFKWGSAEKPFRCQICDMSFTDGNLLREHLDRHNNARKEPAKPFPCNLCTKSFQSNRSLERHQFIHSGQSQKRCKFCYKVFANKENLDKHVKMHVANKSYICQFCNEEFASRTCLENHIPTHTKEKNFKCQHCDKRFNRKDILERHLLTHGIGKRNQHECVECKRSFTYMYALKRHVRSVHGGEPDGRACEVCGKFIKNRENISRHMQLHEGKRPFPCSECGRKFTQKQHLLDHMVTHTEALPFECKICGLLFRFRRSLGRHLQKHYKVHAKSQSFECMDCHLMCSCEEEVIQHTISEHFKVKQCVVCKEEFKFEKDCIEHIFNAHNLSVSFVDKKNNAVNKSTETDPIDHDDITEDAGVENAEVITTTDDVEEANCTENETAVEENDGFSYVKHEFENAEERTEDCTNEESIELEAVEEEPDREQTMIILIDNGQGGYKIQKMNVGQMITQSGMTVDQLIQGQGFSADGNQIIHIEEIGTQSVSDEDNVNEKPEFVKVTAATEDESQDSGDAEMAENYQNIYSPTYEKEGADVKDVPVPTYTLVVPEGEKEDGSSLWETEQSKFMEERSKLLQSLIDYAEKIQVEEISVSSNAATCSSESKI